MLGERRSMESTPLVINFNRILVIFLALQLIIFDHCTKSPR